MNAGIRRFVERNGGYKRVNGMVLLLARWERNRQHIERWRAREAALQEAPQLNIDDLDLNCSVDSPSGPNPMTEQFSRVCPACALYPPGASLPVANDRRAAA